ncbi:MAG: hypothetical protein KDA53_08900 [Hyphomonas sp.]|nr:hypothetical protein [Hyphomonas sp.]
MNPFRSRKPQTQTGFLYAAAAQQDPRFAKAGPGDTIRNAKREAPWLVVNHTLDDVLVAGWPGTLWEVDVTDALQPQGHAGNYTRAVAVTLIRRLPPHTLFGPEGEAVASIVDRAAALTREEAGTLAGNRAAEAGRLYSMAWRNWDGLPACKRSFEDWEGVVGSGEGPPSSPVHSGLHAVFKAIAARAVDLDGDAAMIEEDGPESDLGAHLAEPWATAALCLIEAAMAVGAPHLLAEQDRAVLTRPWRALTGPPRP